MKVGGNESATKYFQTHGGSALLAQKDAKSRYDSPVATKYKDELKRRAAADAKQFPEEVVVTDITSSSSADGASTPSGEPAADDFFSSWDKPSIKRPSNPPSRSATPVTRTASPFLKSGSSVNRSTSPSNSGTEADSSTATSTPASNAPRTISSSALRKTATTSSNTAAGAGTRKGNILGAKRNQKLGAKKVGTSAAEPIDFEEAEKKAKEEAERIAKLGYDPEAEDAAPASESAATPLDKPGSGIVAPTPISPTKAGAVTANAGKGVHQRSASEMERLGMGIGRLGFGQTAGSSAKSGVGAAAGGKRGLGFGSVGPVKAPEEGKNRLRFCYNTSIALTHDTENRELAKMLTQFTSRRLIPIRPPKIRHPKINLLRRVLRQGRLRSQRPSRGQKPPARLRRRHIHQLERLLRPPRRRRGRSRRSRRRRRWGACGRGFEQLRRPGECGAGYRETIRRHDGGRPGELGERAGRGRAEAAGRAEELS